MTHASAHGTVSIRPARSEDRTAMLAITRTVWDGTDYMPFVWDAWLSDRSGYLMVAECGGQVVGIQRVGVHDDGTAWIEGIRVAEAARGSGIGAAMLQHGIRWAERCGCWRARLATASMNPASNRVAERAGMNLARVFVPLDSVNVACQETDVQVRVAAPVEHDAVHALLAEVGADDYSEGWTVYALTSRRLALLLSIGAVLVAGNDGLSAVGIATATRRPSLKLGLLRGDPADSGAIARYVARAAKHSGLTGARAMLAESSAGLLDVSGYVRSGDYRMHLWERVLRPEGH